MAEPRWEMKIGSRVMATDGEYGHLQQVIVDPHQERVVALIVRQHGLPSPHTVVVPEKDVAEATDYEVRLNISLEQVNALPEYEPGAEVDVEGQKYEVDDESFAVRGKRGVQVGRTPTEQRPGMLESQMAKFERERQALQLRSGHTVFCRDGLAGKVSMMLLHPDGRVKGFVMHAGHLPGRNLIVPVAWVQEVDREDVHLSVEKAALKSLPDYSNDFALEAGVYDALWADEILRETDYNDMETVVQDGIVHLRGHVNTPMNRTRAEDAARQVRGVLGVENALIVDEDLVLDVAQALGSDQRTQLERISVGAQHGVIILTGQVESAAIREAAEELAASVPKVRGVANYLHAPNVVIDPQEEQVHEPPINGEVYATDMLVGVVERVIINPHNRRVAAFVVHGYFPELLHPGEDGLSNGTAQVELRAVVPIHSVRYETDNSVELNVSSNEIVQNQDFDPVNFMSPPEDWQPPYPYRWGEVLFEIGERK